AVIGVGIRAVGDERRDDRRRHARAMPSGRREAGARQSLALGLHPRRGLDCPAFAQLEREAVRPGRRSRGRQKQRRDRECPQNPFHYARPLPPAQATSPWSPVARHASFSAVVIGYHASKEPRALAPLNSLKTRRIALARGRHGRCSRKLRRCSSRRSEAGRRRRKDMRELKRRQFTQEASLAFLAGVVVTVTDCGGGGGGGGDDGYGNPTGGSPTTTLAAAPAGRKSGTVRGNHGHTAGVT